MAAIERPRIWRGPFTAKRGGRYNWTVVNRYGEVERTGYLNQTAANDACALRNEAEKDCDSAEVPSSISGKIAVPRG